MIKLLLTRTKVARQLVNMVIKTGASGITDFILYEKIQIFIFQV